MTRTSSTSQEPDSDMNMLRRKASLGSSARSIRDLYLHAIQLHPPEQRADGRHNGSRPSSSLLVIGSKP
ncbi:hypothetical protein CONPUDRAFT_78534 [Coniophora puteana RWD-64-598 SS2]|uniref:Uncharacterized protein n=1 Tax=Coniophora puteana (strain RWD-64-598) TaxID=741705 RepID=A0A5M3N4E4_CONPW|nr:uncharacterized protein CONPUDRAFT_78534 [Coniophora puteana RWD-64-598 SS2]EIW85914.1 hypothetical protein CONPUDRAFT_78534 [Coniophora puteana RWD-64-598 SS2]